MRNVLRSVASRGLFGSFLAVEGYAANKASGGTFDGRQRLCRPREAGHGNRQPGVGLLVCGRKQPRRGDLRAIWARLRRDSQGENRCRAQLLSNCTSQISTTPLAAASPWWISGHRGGAPCRAMGPVLGERTRVHDCHQQAQCCQSQPRGGSKRTSRGGGGGCCESLDGIT